MVYREVLHADNKLRLVVVISHLKRLRKKTADIHEKLAISLYIAQIRRLDPRNKWNMVKNIAKHPMDVTPDELIEYLCTPKKRPPNMFNMNNWHVLDREDMYLLGLATNIRDRQKWIHFK